LWRVERPVSGNCPDDGRRFERSRHPHNYRDRAAAERWGEGTLRAAAAEYDADRLSRRRTVAAQPGHCGEITQESSIAGAHKIGLRNREQRCMLVLRLAFGGGRRWTRV